MIVLITGAFGFVGRNLSSWLALRGHRLWALDVVDGPAQAYERCFTWQQLHAIPRSEPIAVIHLAGKAHAVRDADPKPYFEINLGLTQRIYEWFGRSEARSFAFFSSVKAVADRVPDGPLTEDAEPAPQTPYGQSKLAAERHLLAAPPSGDRRLHILRPCMIHGPGNKGNLNLLYSAVSRGIPYPLGAFDNRRSFTSVDNLCEAVEGLLRVRPPSGIYNMADDEALPTNRIIALVAESLGRRPLVWRVPRGLVRAAARAGDCLHLPLNTERLDKLTETYVVSNAKLRQALGLAHFPVRAEDGLRRTFASFKGQIS